MDEKKEETEKGKEAEQTPEKDKQESSKENSDDGGKPKEKTPIEEAKEINKKKEDLLEREEKLMDRKEKLEATRMVGGTTEAGQTPIKETEDEKWAKDAKERYAGTGMSPVEGDDGE